MTIREAGEPDQDALGAIAEAAGLFPAEMLPDFMAPALSGSGEVWLLAETGGVPVGFAFARPEEVADRVWNILALGVSETERGQGLGASLVAEMERRLEARMIVIETTQLEDQAPARRLYKSIGYEEEGRVRDFYANGEDKVIFRKLLA